jgi:hypothetical protein
MNNNLFSSFGWFALFLFYSILILIPIEIHRDVLGARIFFTIAAFFPLPFFLVRNTKLFIWRIFNNDPNDDRFLNLFSFLLSHFALLLIWALANVSLFVWNEHCYSNFLLFDIQNSYGVWLVFVYGTFGTVLGSAPDYQVAPTHLASFSLVIVQRVINFIFAASGLGLIAAIHRQWLTSKTTTQPMTSGLSVQGPGTVVVTRTNNSKPTKSPSTKQLLPPSNKRNGR